MKQRTRWKQNILVPALLMVALLASSCTDTLAAADTQPGSTDPEPATTIEIDPAETLPTATPIPEPTATPVPEPTATPIPGESEPDPEVSDGPIRIEAPNDPVGWPDTPIPESQAERDEREAELLGFLAGEDLDFDESSLWRLELTRLRQAKAEEVALEYHELAYEILISPLTVDRDELDRIAELSNPETDLQTFGERLLVATIDRDNRYLDDEYPTGAEVVGSVMQGFSVMVTICSETTGIWRSLTTDEITRETGASATNNIYEVDTVGNEMFVRQLRNLAADGECELAERWPEQSS